VLVDGSPVAPNYYTLVMTPSVLGDRVGIVSQIFTRFKFNSLRFMLRSKLPVTAVGTTVHGVLDDDNPATTLSQPAILDFRTSQERHSFSDQTLVWTPIDRTKWYYVSGSSDGRFTNPCTYVWNADDPGTGSGVPQGLPIASLDIAYSITFEGANPVGEQLRSQLHSVEDEAYVSLPPTPSGRPPTAVPLKNPPRPK
jgi:hypothetical protein